MPRIPLPRAAAVALSLAVLVGCTPVSAPSSDGGATDAVRLADIGTVGDPKAIEGGSTAVLADPAIEPVTASPSPALPATVTSHDLDGDTEVTVDSVERVLAIDLAGSLAATVVGLGLADTLVGRDISTTIDELAELPVVTSGGHSVNSESIIALRPTLVITDGSIGPIDVVLQLRDAGIPVVFVESDESADGAADIARQVAAAMGVPAEGELLAQRILDETEAMRARIAEIAPAAEADKLRMVFLYLRGSAGIYYLFGEESGADELIRDLGGIDVAAEIGWTGMKPMTDEALIAADPDLILVMTGGIESVGGIDQLLADKPAIALTTAGEKRRFVDMADGDILSFGPRLPSVLEALAVAVYAPSSTD